MLPRNTEERYDAAQVCLNGHIINFSAGTLPQFNQKFCDKCGAPTLMECPKCQTSVRGHYLDGGFSFDPDDPPAYCHECGAPYPWTEAKLQAAQELADELGELSDTDRERFKASLTDIATETPKSQLAQSRMKTLLSKLGKDSYEAAKSILFEIASETAKKALFGP